MDRSKYPPDWEKIALRIKEQSSWKCEVCGKQCRKPDETFDTHQRTLTVAHINHVESDCREENLIAACAPCHLVYDAPMKAMRRRVKNRKPNQDDFVNEPIGKWLPVSDFPGDGMSIWIAVLEHSGQHVHTDYAQTFVDYDEHGHRRLFIARYEGERLKDNSLTLSTIWPPHDVLAWRECDTPYYEGLDALV